MGSAVEEPPNSSEVVKMIGGCSILIIAVSVEKKFCDFVHEDLRKSEEFVLHRST